MRTLWIITNSNHIDVLEMDAASKTGVDDVRDLIEFSRWPALLNIKFYNWRSSYA